MYRAYIHTSNFSTEDVILNHEIFPDIFEGDYIRVTDAENSGGSIGGVILQIGKNQTGRFNLEISLSKTIADPFNLKPYSLVNVEKVVNKQDVEVDFVELSFRRQFLQRGNMYIFKRSMVDRPVHVRQNVAVGGVQAQIQELANNGTQRLSGIVTNKTKFIFRSRSTRIIWLVQISAEMWEYDQSGDLYFEKFLNKFVDPVMEKWKELQVSHALTIIFFARSLYLDPVDPIKAPELSSKKSLKPRSYDGLKCQDFFKVVIANAGEVPKTAQLKALKEEFWSFPRNVGWNLGRTGGGSIAAVPSDASGGNMLEAINTALNLLDKHYMDRDLTCTGNSIVVISAGTGVFRVNQDMALITKQRMMDGGIGIDFISLSQPPVHIVPLFHVDTHSMKKHGGGGGSGSGSGGGADRNKYQSYYEFPHWMKVSYVDCPEDSRATVNQSGSYTPGGGGGRGGRFSGVIDSGISSSSMSSNNSSSSSNSSGNAGAVASGSSGLTLQGNGISSNGSGDDLMGLPGGAPSGSSNRGKGGGGSGSGDSGGGGGSGPGHGGFRYRRTSVRAEEYGDQFLPQPFPSEISGHAHFRNEKDIQINALASPLIQCLRSMQQNKSEPLNLPSVGTTSEDLDGSESPTGERRKGGGGEKDGGGSGGGLDLVKEGINDKDFVDFAGGFRLAERETAAAAAAAVESIPEWGFVDLSSLPPPAREEAGYHPPMALLDVSPTAAVAAAGPTAAGTSRKQLSSAFHGQHSIPDSRSAEAAAAVAAAVAVAVAVEARDGGKHNLATSLASSKGSCDGGGIAPLGDRFSDATSRLSPYQHEKDDDICTLLGRGAISDVSQLLALLEAYDDSLFPDPNTPAQRGPTSHSMVPSVETNSGGICIDTQSLQHQHQHQHQNQHLQHHPSGSGSGSGALPHFLSVEGLMTASRGPLEADLKPAAMDSGRAAAAAAVAAGKPRSNSNPASYRRHSPIATGRSVDGDVSASTAVAAGADASLTAVINSIPSSSSDILGEAWLGRAEPMQLGVREPLFDTITTVCTDVSRSFDREDELKLLKMRAGGYGSPGNASSTGSGGGGGGIGLSKSPKAAFARTGASGSLSRAGSSGSGGSGGETGRRGGPAFGILPRGGSMTISPSSRKSHPELGTGTSPQQGLGDLSKVDMPKGAIKRSKHQINPFKREEGVEFLKLRTHNRMRWSHVFPSGKLDAKKYYGLNFKSLCQPAILPLTTTFIDPANVMMSEFTCYPSYNLIRDPAVFKTPESWLDEMVCQRLSQEYQLVENVDMGDTSKGPSYYNFLKEFKGSDKHFILSMGHRIHFFIYDPVADGVKVFRAVANYAFNEDLTKDMIGVSTQYEYEVWMAQMGCYQTESQVFNQFPSEYQWNKSDEILLGNLDLDQDAVKALKPKRVRFALIPELVGPEQMEAYATAYFAKFEKLLTLLKSKMSDPLALSIKYERPGSETSVSAADKPRTAVQVRLAKLWLPSYQSKSTKWTQLVYDSVVSISRVFHLELHWVACDSWLMSDLVNTLAIRCKSVGLRLVQIPEVFATADLHIHPYRAQPFVAVPIPLGTVATSGIGMQLTQPENAVVSWIQRHYFLGNPEEWIEDKEQTTDWGDAKLPKVERSSSSSIPTPLLPTTSALSQNLERHEYKAAASGQLKDKNKESGAAAAAAAAVASGKKASTVSMADWKPRAPTAFADRSEKRKGDRQYLHRTGYAAVRVGTNGFVWLKNPFMSTTAEGDKLNELRNKCQAVSICYDIAYEVVEGGMNEAISAETARSGPKEIIEEKQASSAQDSIETPIGGFF